MRPPRRRRPPVAGRTGPRDGSSWSGLGLAGLTAALDLVEAGWEVTVLEARGPGGWSGAHDPIRGVQRGLHAEAGGESIDTDHEDLLALIDRFGLSTEDASREQDHRRAHLVAGPALEDRRLRRPRRRRGRGRVRTLLRRTRGRCRRDRPRAPGGFRAGRRTRRHVVGRLRRFARPESRGPVPGGHRQPGRVQRRGRGRVDAVRGPAVGGRRGHHRRREEAMRIAGGNDLLVTAMADELGDVVTAGSTRDRDPPWGRGRHRGGGR